MNKNAREILEADYPTRVRSHFCAAVARGYSMTKELVKNTEFLNNPLGEDIIPYLKNVAVPFYVMKVLQALGRDYSLNITRNDIGNCHHAEINAENSVMTICQVDRRSVIPRYSIFRDNLGMQNDQICMFTPEPLECKAHILLTHGYGSEEPKFVRVGIPHSTRPIWIDFLDLDRSLQVSGTGIFYEEERITEEELVAFKNFAGVGVMGNERIENAGGDGNLS